MNEARELWRHQRTDNSECNFATIDVVYLAHGIPGILGSREHRLSIRE